MRRLSLLCGNIIFYIYLAVLSLAFEIHLPYILVVFLLGRRGRFGDAMRAHNARYGVFLSRILWPVARVSRSGVENIPSAGPVMVVYNHRSAADPLFTPLALPANVAMLVRAWPFRLPLLGWHMRLAGYIDVESTPFDEVSRHVRALSARGVGWVAFPEGHRSRDGRLQRFKSGPFVLAADADMPVLPVCVTGTEKLCRPGSPLLRPARVHLEILPLVYPASFPAEKRALKLRRHVESIFREQLGE